MTRAFQYSVFAENKRCSETKLCSPNAPSGSYVIDPDGEGGVTPVTINCGMTDKNNIGVTVISHDSEDRIPEHWCKDKILKDATNVIFTTLELISSS